MPDARALPQHAADDLPPCVSRREFVSAATWSVLATALAACGGGSDGPTGPSAAGVSFANGIVSIPLGSVPTLAQAGGYLITNGGDNDVRDSAGSRPNVIVVNVGPDQWRAFTSVCTHEGCTVSDFAGGRINCRCHGSQFDSSGRAVVGPATLPLREYPLRYDAATRVVTVQRS